MIVEKFLRDQQIRVDPLVELDSLETIAILVSEGLGVSIVPHWKGLDRFAREMHISPPLTQDYERRLCMIIAPQNRNNPLWNAFRAIVADCSVALHQPALREPVLQRNPRGSGLG